MIDQKYVDYAVEQTMKLLAIDSPTGYTEQAAEACLNEFRALGCKAWLTGKGGVVAELGGENEQDALWVEAHIDTLGGMVSEIQSNGRLRISPLGGLRPENTETENCRVITKFNGVYEGTLQLDNASVHVNGSYGDTVRKFTCMEVVLDEDVKSADDTKKLGISAGDIVCFDPRSRVTEKGYIKSRFLDDKLSVGILLGLAKYLHDEGVTPKRKVYAHVTVYEVPAHRNPAGP